MLGYIWWLTSNIIVTTIRRLIFVSLSLPYNWRLIFITLALQDKIQTLLPRGVRAIDYVTKTPKKDVHNLSIEILATIFISMQETIMSLQKKMHASKESELDLHNAMEI